MALPSVSDTSVWHGTVAHTLIPVNLWARGLRDRALMAQGSGTPLKGPAMRLALTLICCLLASAVAAQQNDTSNPIIARMDALVQAFNARDLAAIGAIYAPDAVLMLPGEPTIRGREAIVAQYAAAFAAEARALQFMTFDIRGFDQNAVEIGETVMMVGERRVVGRYMHLWEVVEDRILLTRDMYHVLSAE